MEDDFESFKLEENIHHLETLKTLSFENIKSELSNHVTRIYNRDEILTSILLTYCSPLWLNFIADGSQQ
jgi:hypothetical protein